MNKQKQVYIILFLNFLIVSLFNFAHPVTPEMMREKGVADFLFGIFFMMMSIGSFIASPFWGKKMDLNGTKKYMVIGPLVYAVGQFIFMMSPIAIGMIFGRFLSGVCASAWIVGTNTAVNILSDEENKAKNFGYVIVSMSMSTVVGQLLSGEIGKVVWYHSFLFQIIGLIIMSIAIALILPNYQNQVVREKSKINFGDAFKVIKEENIKYSLMGIVSYIFVINIIKSAPSYYISEKISIAAQATGSQQLQSLSVSSVSFINSSASLAMMLFTLFMIGYVSRKYDFMGQVKFQLRISLLAFIVFFSTITLDYYNILNISIYAYLGLIIISLFFLAGPLSMNRPLTQKQILTKSHGDSGQIIGIINAASSIGMILASLSFSLFYMLSPIICFALIGVGLIIGYIVYSVAAKREY